MNELKKLCSRCKLEQDITNFTLRKNTNTYVSICKICTSKKTLEWQSQLFDSQDPEDMINATFHKISQSARSNAKIRNVEYSISIKDMREQYKIQDGKCYYTNTQMNLRNNDHLNRDPFLISIDRKNSDIGYANGNVVFCCWGCNALKGYHNESIFYNALKTFYENAKTFGKI